MKRALLIALLGCSCHAYDQTYLDCVSSGHCVDPRPDGGGDAGTHDAGVPVDAGLYFDDTHVDLGTTPSNVRSTTVARLLINERASVVGYTVTVQDPHLDIVWLGVDGGPACDATGIPASSECRWDVSMRSDIKGNFNSYIDVDTDLGLLQLFVTAVVQ
jgi:hypothetical protein